MKHLLSVKQVRKADNYAIENLKIPSAILMENASRSSSDFIRSIICKKNLINPKIAVFCGSGNNGGDGFAIARHLKNNLPESPVKVFLNGSPDKMSDETKINYNILKNLDFEITEITESQISGLNFDFDIIIDSMIGVGGSENLRGKIIPLLKNINQSKALKIAIDIPSGLNSDTGAFHDDTFVADYTITMFAEKKGMYLNNASQVTGHILTADLGAPESIVEELSDTAIIEKKDIRKILPKRKSNSIKFDYGRVLIIAGSKDMPGAAALAANASVRAGAGLTYLVTPNIHHSLFPEVITFKTSSDIFKKDDLELITEKAKKADVIALGPGIGNKPESVDMLRELIYSINPEIPLVLDADAIKAINPDDVLHKNIILTPHIGEFAGLIGEDRKDIADSAYQTAIETAKKMNCIIHLKHHPSITTDGKNTYLLEGNNPALSCGGSGDVLTGIISALAAQKVNSLNAAALGAYIHLHSSLIMSEDCGYEAFKATDITEGLKKVFQ